MKMKSIFVFLSLADNQCDFSVHKILGIPRSSMWTYISDLEKSLGKKLINRKKQSLSFTADGEAFIPYARKIYEAYEESLECVQRDNDHVEGDLYISTTTAIALQWSMENIKKLYAKYPNLRLHITATDCLEKDEENAYDIHIRPFYNSDTFSRLFCIEYHHGLFASQDYVNQMGQPSSPRDLISHRLVGYGEHLFSHFENINWHLKGDVCDMPKLKPVLTVNSTKAIYAAAEQGIGICSVPIESNNIYKGNLIRVLPYIDGPTIQTHFSVKKSAIGRKQKNIILFRKFFEEHIRSLNVKIKLVDED